MRLSRLILLYLLLVPLLSAEPRRGGTLRVGRAGDSLTLDPAMVFDDQSHLIVDSLFQGLVQFSTENMDIQPCLATSWNTNADNTRWTFNLRRDVMFHDGTPMNADAVVFSLMRQIDPKHPHHQPEFIYADASFRHVSRVTAVDAYTVEITLTQPFAPFLANMALAAANIVSPTAVKRYGRHFNQRPVGTGPFYLREWLPEKQVVIGRNERYWGQAPWLDQVIFIVVHDTGHRLVEYQTQRIDWLVDLSIKHRSKLKNLPDTRLIKREGHSVFYLAMNTRKKPFDQVKVRRAVNHAVNRDKLVKLVFQDYQVPAVTPLPPGMWGFNNEIQPYKYNPDLARRMLAEAGYPDGFEVTLIYFNGTNAKGIDRILKAALENIGIRVKIKLADWRVYTEATKRGEHDICLDNWSGDNGDPDNFLYTLFSTESADKEKGFNLAFYENSDLDHLLVKARGTLDRGKRDKLYQQAQTIIHKDAPWLPICHPRGAMALRDRVKGQVQLANGWIRFDKVWLE